MRVFFLNSCRLLTSLKIELNWFTWEFSGPKLKRKLQSEPNHGFPGCMWIFGGCTGSNDGLEFFWLGKLQVVHGTHRVDGLTACWWWWRSCFFFCWDSQAGSAINPAWFDDKLWKREGTSSDTGDSGGDRRISEPSTVLLMEEIPNNHLGCIRPCKEWDKLPAPTGDRRISEPSTVWPYDHTWHRHILSRWTFVVVVVKSELGGLL